jgi:hypothetical protein
MKGRSSVQHWITVSLECDDHADQMSEIIDHG